MPKLTSEQVRAIRHAHAEGVSLRALAATYHLSSGTVGKIVRHEMWKILPPVQTAPVDAADIVLPPVTGDSVDVYDAATGETITGWIDVAVEVVTTVETNGAVCTVDLCGRAAVAQSLCSSHYYRQRRYGDPTATRIRTPEAQLDENIARCKVLTSDERCPYPAHSYGWCQAHWRRWQEHGDVQADIPVTRRSQLPGRCTHPDHPAGEAPYVYAIGLCKMHYRRDQRARQHLAKEMV